jgi:hypothetical protein
MCALVHRPDRRGRSRCQSVAIAFGRFRSQDVAIALFQSLSSDRMGQFRPDAGCEDVAGPRKCSFIGLIRVLISRSQRTVSVGFLDHEKSGLTASGGGGGTQYKKINPAQPPNNEYHPYVKNPRK